MRSAQQRQRGFTLLETMAATALLAVGLTLLLNGMGDALQGYAQDEVKVRMAEVARSLFAESTVQRLHAGNDEGVRDGITWRMEYRLLDALPGIGLYRLELTLRHAQREERFISQRLQRLTQADER